MVTMMMAVMTVAVSARVKSEPMSGSLMGRVGNITQDTRYKGNKRHEKLIWVS